MIRSIPFLFLILLSCDAPVRSNEPFPLQPEPLDKGWIVYEGRVPLDEKRNLYLEVQMRPGNGGEGDYRLTETMEEEGSGYRLPAFSGRYSTFYGASQEDLVLRFHNTVQMEEVKRIYYDPISKRSRSGACAKPTLSCSAGESMGW